MSKVVNVTKVVDFKWGKQPHELVLDLQDDGDVSDGHHTISELYEHRHALYLALVKIYDNYITPLNRRVLCWKSRVHDDGSTYEGWFLLGMTVTRPSFVEGADPEVWDISYHLPEKYWNMANVITLEKAPKFTGYTPQDVIERLLKL